MLAVACALVSSIGGTPVKTAVVVPGWPKLPYPFETGIVTCNHVMTAEQHCLLHVSGLPGIDFSTNPPGIVKGGIGNETRQALSNIEAVAKAAHSSMDNFMECTVFMSNSAIGPSSFEEMNDAYKDFFGAIKPTRAAFYVKLIGTSLVEIKCSGFAPPPPGDQPLALKDE